MGFFKELFNRGYDLKALKVKLRQVERERRKFFLELRKLASRQQSVIEDIKAARKLGNTIEVDYLWEDLKDIKHELNFTRRAARVSNLEGITLKRYVHGIERLERARDKDGIQKMLTRIQSSGLDAKLQMAQVNEEEYMAELNSILEAAGLEDEYSEGGSDDPEKNRFMSEIDAINQAEVGGEFETALKKEQELKKILESDEQAR
ncbi:MAG: hypothetical protein L6Q71_10150 [Planctomycetes bacterium]|nr:hypothetical protein [Planctomycetota bacterium]NUQ34576.1 hypothetical protein [Planctomycetaceae bacterium]